MTSFSPRTYSTTDVSDRRRKSAQPMASDATSLEVRLGDIESVDSRRKWWKRGSKRSGKKSAEKTSRSLSPSPRRLDLGAVVRNDSNTDEISGKSSLFSSIKDWARGKSTPRSPRTPWSQGGASPRDPVDHGNVHPDFAEFGYERKSSPLILRQQLSPRQGHNRGNVSELQPAKSAPLAFDDVFLPPHSDNNTGLIPASARGTRRDKISPRGLDRFDSLPGTIHHSSKGAGCRDERRRRKGQQSAGSGSATSQSTKSAVSSAGVNSSSYLASVASTFYTDDLEEQGAHFKEIPQDVEELRPLPGTHLSAPVRTVRRVSSGCDGTEDIIDTIRSSCNDDLEPAGQKRKKKFKARRFFRFFRKQPSLNVWLESSVRNPDKSRHAADSKGSQCKTQPDGSKRLRKMSSSVSVDVTRPSNAGSASTSAYSRRQEAIGKIMEKRLRDLSTKKSSSNSRRFRDGGERPERPESGLRRHRMVVKGSGSEHKKKSVEKGKKKQEK